MRGKATRVFGLAVLSLMVSVFLVASASAAPIVIKLGHYSTADLPFPGQGIAPNVTVFKNYVEQASNGELKVEIHPNAVLGSVRPMIELTQSGAIHMTVPYTSIMVPFVPEMGITQTPFLFKDHVVAYRTMQGALGKELNDLWVKNRDPHPELGRRVGLPTGVFQSQDDQDARGHERPKNPRA